MFANYCSVPNRFTLDNTGPLRYLISVACRFWREALWRATRGKGAFHRQSNYPNLRSAPTGHPPRESMELQQLERIEQHIHSLEEAYERERQQRDHLEKKYARLKRRFVRLERSHAKLLQDTHAVCGAWILLHPWTCIDATFIFLMDRPPRMAPSRHSHDLLKP